MLSFSAVGVNMRWITAGATRAVSARARAPIRTETGLDLANEELELKIFTTQNTVSRQTAVPFGFYLRAALRPHSTTPTSTPRH